MIRRRNQAGQVTVEYALLCLIVTLLAYPVVPLFIRAATAIIKALNNSLGLPYP